MLCCAEQAIIFYSIQLNKRLIIDPYHIMDFMKERIIMAVSSPYCSGWELLTS